MRIIIILNPTEKRGTKTAYTNFRKFLLKDGYIRIGNDVFMRITANRKTAEKHYHRAFYEMPKTGIIRILGLTEKQYQNISISTGDVDYQEEMIGAKCNIML